MVGYNMSDWEQTNVDIATKTEAVLMNRAMSMPLASSAVVRKIELYL